MFQTFWFSYWEGVTGIFLAPSWSVEHWQRFVGKFDSLYSSDLCLLQCVWRKPDAGMDWKNNAEHRHFYYQIQHYLYHFFSANFFFFPYHFHLYYSTQQSPATFQGRHPSASLHPSSRLLLPPWQYPNETPTWAASHAGLRLLHESLVFSHEVCKTLRNPEYHEIWLRSYTCV